MRDPKQYCIKCDTRYSPSDEECRVCGFAPCDNDSDEDEQEEAEAVYAKQQSES